MKLEDRKLKEMEHSDRRRAIVKGYEYKTDASGEDLDTHHVANEAEYETHFSNMKFYSVTESSNAYRQALLDASIKNAVALDYCCGNGEVAIEMAKRGAKKVFGIDISKVAVDNATQLAKKAGVGDICEFKVMDAEHTGFADSTFDVIHEYGALHHLKLSAAYAELSRILKPAGKLVATETLRHNPAIHWYRKRTPHLRTEWEVEHILGIPEIESGGEHFSSVKVKTFHLLALGAVPFRKAPLFKQLLRSLSAIDTVLLKLPFVRKMAWIAVVEYSNPKKA